MNHPHLSREDLCERKLIRDQILFLNPTILILIALENAMFLVSKQKQFWWKSGHSMKASNLHFNFDQEMFDVTNETNTTINSY